MRLGWEPLHLGGRHAQLLILKREQGVWNTAHMVMESWESFSEDVRLSQSVHRQPALHRVSSTISPRQTDRFLGSTSTLAHTLAYQPTHTQTCILLPLPLLLLLPTYHFVCLLFVQFMLFFSLANFLIRDEIYMIPTLLPSEFCDPRIMG